MFNKIGFIGLGLIGGSIAKTVHRHCPEAVLKAYDVDKTNTSAAHEAGIIAADCATVEALADCDLIFIATPVDCTYDYIAQLAAVPGFHGLITDAGSVKNDICQRVARMSNPPDFVGGHPMAGSELTGFQHAHDHLFENAYYFLTPLPGTPMQDVDRLHAFLKRLNVLPVVIDPADHDMIVALISHLPHLVAASLVNLVRRHDRFDYLKRFCAGGFRDITRIASGSPGLWSQITGENAQPLLTMLNDFRTELDRFADHLEDTVPTFPLFQAAKNYRDTLPRAGTGLIERTYIIYCDLNDEVGAIAKMANHLYMNDINIKNIAIENSREFEEGALRIELYDESTYEQAKCVLQKYNYKIFR
ncbi:MAG: prephenate dehydrogenase/arogenate dehydrogenase family protein [Eubacteriales bacterium]|nr:prephenate dehydrogenase/arogenate dehydrogenase family protein [Eubacteriales bacterium]